ncbi:type II toxin-antitoxin system VapC family toxin [uncultured Jatrophihabitans sp.]|uniref:type II toxin-antitoxin system VapC family toxin n=1 Tax=uncultured Jatrophihabitans sp. TaxID=1610747 RepID=UPI0035CB2C31
MMDCFDADVLIYAAAPGHPLGRKVKALLSAGPDSCAGSVLLLPEVLSKPLRSGAVDEVAALAGLLGRLQMQPVDRPTADLATFLAGRYHLHAADAVHCATAVRLGADRFITNNRRDFTTAITEVGVVYPDDLPETT